MGGDFEGDVLIDDSVVVRFSAVGHDDSLLLDGNAVQKDADNKCIGCFCNHVFR